MSYLDEIRKREKEEEQRDEEKKKENKCYNCEWGRWDGKKHLCMFSQCFKERKR